MLLQLAIQNFAIVEKLDIEFQNGMTVITGETGAGKSIIIDALELALGARANTHLIRDSHDKAEVSASFDITRIPAAQAWLREHEMADDHSCIIRRIISHDGRHRCFINNIPTTLQALKQLGETIISIHGQHENQALLKPEHQRELLDGYAQHATLLAEVEKNYSALRAAEEELERLKSVSSHGTARVDLLTFQLEELHVLKLQPGEYEQLDQELSRQQYASDIANQQQFALDVLSENVEANVQTLLTKATQALESIQKHEPRVKNSIELLKQSLITADEAIHELQNISTENNTDNLADLEARVSTIHELARKHRVEPGALYARQQQLETELAQLDCSEERIKQLEQEIKEATEHYQTSAKKLTASRQKSSKKLNALITERMRVLGMPHGSFEINLKALDQPSLHGHESIHFLVNTNPGMALQALNKTASGGELSRISLAIQVITAEQHLTPVLIFDEVDVGIGGATADVIGEQLALLGKTHQVFCITHLGQVAAKAHQHFQVNKQVIKGKTVSTLTALEGAKRVEEIARMIGGKTVTRQTIAHAEQLLEINLT